MTDTTLIDAIKTRPDTRRLLLSTAEGGLGLNDGDLTTMIAGQIPSVTKEIVTSHEWDFAMHEFTDPTGTVADQSEYDLAGENGECLQVASIRYGEDETLLTLATAAWLEDYMSRNRIARPLYWRRFGRTVANVPMVKIIATPTTAGEQIKYRYWKNNINLQHFDDSFQFVFESCILKHLFPAFASLFETDLGRAIAGYEPSSGAIQPTVLDKAITQANQRRAALYGWSGN